MCTFDVYIYSNYFTIETWNHFFTEHECTNDRVEADNGSMKLAFGAANPDINKATQLLRQYEVKSRKDRLNALESICLTMIEIKIFDTLVASIKRREARSSNT